MKILWISLLSIVLTACKSADREIDQTFESYCNNSSVNVSEIVAEAICDNEKYRRAIVSEYLWFQNEADIERFFYRLFGVIVIVFSISIPILTQSELKYKKLLVTITSCTVAIGTSLSTFFSWGEMWANYRTAEYEYRAEIRRWDMEMLRIVRSTDSDIEKAKLVSQYTQHFVKQTEFINMKANKQFFTINGGSFDSYTNDVER